MRRGFTLVEVMIVVMIAVIILSIAVPSFVRDREVGRAASCSRNLTALAEAKARWALEVKPADDAECTLADLTPYLKEPVECKAGGTYAVGTLTQAPMCSKGANADKPELSHVKK